MKHLGFTGLFLSLALIGTSATADAAPRKRGVGMGIAAGIAIPDADNVDFGTSFNWGFFTDIPLLSSFHITPSAYVYELKVDGQPDVSATDVSVNFKFMVPLGKIDLFAGVIAGLTSAQELDPHVGALGGLAINLVSNIDVFAQLNYRLILNDGDNIRDVQIYAGPLFRFE